MKKEIINNLELDANSIAVYVSLRSIYVHNVQTYYVSINMLVFLLFRNSLFTRYTKQNIQSGLQLLINNKLIQVIENISRTEYILDLSKLHINSAKETKEYYITIEDDEIYKICNIQENVDKFSILRFYISLLGTINHSQGVYDGIEEISNFVGYMPIEYIASISGISKRVVIKYTKILEKQTILFVYRHDKYIVNDIGQLRSICNHYGRMENKKYIIQFAQEYEEKIGLYSDETKAKKKRANNGRSLSQKYNAMIKGVMYDTKTVKEIFRYIHSYNVEIQKQIDKKVYGWEKMQEQMKSEDVFSKYIDIEKMEDNYNE